MSSSGVVVRMAADEELQQYSLSTRDGLLDGVEDDDDGVPRLRSSFSSSSRSPRHNSVLMIAMVVAVLLAVAWLGRMSADPSLFPHEHGAEQTRGPYAIVASSGHVSTADTTANTPLPTAYQSSACPTSTCRQHRPAAFMNLFHNTLLPDLSLSNEPYPVSSTRLPGGELPELNVYYCMSGSWFQYILDDTFPAMFSRYRRVSTWDPAMHNLWSLQSFSPDRHEVPSAMNRSIGQRRIYITGEPRSILDVHDMDAVFDTKTSPLHHPTTANFVYLPNVYAAHYDFINAGQPRGEQAKYSLSLIKPPHYSQRTNFTQRRFMAYMQSNCLAYRDELFDLVSQYKRVDGIGSCKHNMPDTFDRKAEWWQSIQIYENYKFALTLESHVIDGYITEKILAPMITGTIPVYMGSSDIGDHFNVRAFIDVGRLGSMEKVMERIMYLDQNDTAYAEMLDEPWLVDNTASMWMPHNNNGSYLHQQLAALRDVLLHPMYAKRMERRLPVWANENEALKRRQGMEYLRG